MKIISGILPFFNTGEMRNSACLVIQKRFGNLEMLSSLKLKPVSYHKEPRTVGCEFWLISDRLTWLSNLHVTKTAYRGMGVINNCAKADIDVK